MKTNLLHSHSIDSCTSCGFLRLLAVCGKIRNFLCLLAAGFSTSCVSNVLAGKPQKQHFLFLAPACVFLRRKNFLGHFLRVLYFWAVLYLKVQEEMKEVTLGAKANKKLDKRLKKACKTR